MLSNGCPSVPAFSRNFPHDPLKCPFSSRALVELIVKSYGCWYRDVVLISFSSNESSINHRRGAQLLSSPSLVSSLSRIIKILHFAVKSTTQSPNLNHKEFVGTFT